MIEVVDGVRERERDVVELFRCVGEANGWVYPPAVRLQQVGSLEGWVWLSEGALRWDAVSDEGVTVGSVQLHLLGPADDESGSNSGLVRWEEIAKSVSAKMGHSISFDSLALVERLAVHPDYRREGLGGSLLSCALQHAWSVGRVTALDVLASQKEALRLYERMGGVIVGETTGLSGLPIYRVWLPELHGT